MQTLKDMADTLREQGRFEETVRLALEQGLVTREELQREGLLPENFGGEIRPANVAPTAPGENKQIEGYTTTQSAPPGLPPVAQPETASAQVKVDEGDSGGKIEEDAAQMPRNREDLEGLMAIAVQEGLKGAIQEIFKEAEQRGIIMNKKENAAEPLKTNSPREDLENEQKQAEPSVEPLVAEPILHTVTKGQPLSCEGAAGEGFLEEGEKMEREKAEAPSDSPFKGKLKSWSMPSREEVYSVLGSRAAFTLVELLVVMAILSILAGMLLPALGKVVKVARQTQCASNLRQIHLGMRMYMDDWKQYTPCTGEVNNYWYDQLDDYLPNPRTWDDASNKGTGANVYRCASQNGGARSNYAINLNVAPSSSLGGHIKWGMTIYNTSDSCRRLLKVSETAWIVDYDTGSIYFNRTADRAPYIGFRHFGRTNVLYMDGHMGVAEEFWVLDNRYTNEGATFWGSK